MDVSVTPKQEPLDIPMKKSKIDEQYRYFTDLYSHPVFLYQITQLSRQQPWPATSPKHIIPPFGQSHVTSIPYLPTSQEPPVLQNPERVVRHTESERFERSYQPNVALAPRQTVLSSKEREEREPSERSSSVIKCEIQIKQERPSTPSNESPELRNNSPETTDNGVTSAAPISPEGQSGSNEITSSTSPVPATIPKSKQESMSPPPSSQASPRLTSPRSHLHKTSPSVVVKVLSTSSPATNGVKKVPILGNPEFELSTDTDEESLGEPDSSNLNGTLAQTPYEVAKLLLKSNTQDDREKVLDLIKYMEKEITQQKEVTRKQMRDLQQQNESLRKTIDSMQSQLSQPSRPLTSSNVIAPSCLSSSSSSSSSSLSSSSSYDFDRRERSNSIVEKPNVIIKPLKKSLRITPIIDDCKPIVTANSITSTPSIVIMPKREDIINNNNNTKLYNNNAPHVNGQTESSLDETLQKTTIKAEKL
jgi:hypothetical protein